MESFDIYFLGETLPSADPTTVREGVGRLFKLEGDAVDRLFSGKPLRVKKGVDVDAASRYRAAFREVGALIRIVPGGAPPPAPGAAPAPTVARPSPAPTLAASAGSSASAAPTTQDPAPASAPAAAQATPEPNDERAALAQTLTLTIVEETFAEEDSLPIPAKAATPAMTLAEPGATIDHTPPPPPADIDTGGLEALPPNTGSLADCQVEKPPRPIPDISHLRLVDD